MLSKKRRWTHCGYCGAQRLIKNTYLDFLRIRTCRDYCRPEKWNLARRKKNALDWQEEALIRRERSKKAREEAHKIMEMRKNV